MTYEVIETSLHDGAPVELYEFRLGAQAWRYTSAAEAITANLVDWRPVSISRSEIEATSDMARNNLTLTLARDLEVPELFRIAPPSGVVTLTVHALHLTDQAAETVVVWKGRVVNVAWKGLAAELTCEPLYTSLRRIGLRRTYQRQCPHLLYGDDCRVVRAAHEVAGSAASVSGATLTVPEAGGYADGWFAGGMIELELTPGVITRRSIRTHTGQALGITHPIPGLGAGQAVTLIPGCDRTPTDCADKFDNLLNYGGWPYIPIKNPFSGGSVF